MNDVKICKEEGCEKIVVAHKLCQMHHYRFLTHGSTENPRPKDWGDRNKHPLYAMWKNLRRFRREQSCDIWLEDFWQFTKDIVERPSKNHLIRPIDISKKLSKDNFYWHELVLKGQTKQQVNKYTKKWLKLDRIHNPDKYKNKDLRKNFGIGIEEFNLLKQYQNHLCAICKRPETHVNSKTNKKFDLSVDHCHTTHKIRGLLCANCNRALGLFRDNIQALEDAIEYLKNPIFDKIAESSTIKLKSK